MNKLLIAAISLGTLTIGAAQAADLGVRRAPPAAMMSAPACAQFGGFYVGISGGGGAYSNTWNDRDGWSSELSDDLQRSNVRADKFGAVAGGGGGYNWQRGCSVFGVEVDYSWSNLKTRTFETDSDTGLDLDSLTIESKLRGIGTARTRAGVVVDSLLLYATGGLAFANFKRSATMTDNSVPESEIFSSSKWRLGWTAGVGTEWAINSNWSLKSEVLYAAFAKDEQSFSCSAFCGPAEQKRFDNQDSVWITRVGVNYRWGGAAPIVARY
jgi:outer membrane immunogenic protein